MKDRSLSSWEKESLATGEGEWWMSYEDFTKCFTHLTICHPEPEPATMNALKVAWREASFEVGSIKCSWFSTDSVGCVAFATRAFATPIFVASATRSQNLPL